MICQRSGQCCITMAVIIPGPSKGGLRALMKPGMSRCPYLSFNVNNKASCAVHDLPFFKGSPCWVYGNPDVDPDFEVKRGRPCLVGKHLRANEVKTQDVYATTTLGQLEDLGPWSEET